MSEINETPKSRKKLFITVGAVAAALAIAAGGIAVNANSDTIPDAAPSVTATATASPSATATPVVTGTAQPTSEYKGMQEATQEDKDRILGAFYGSPLGINIEDVYANHLDSDVLATFPEGEFKTKAGIGSILNTYQEMTAITAWAQARDTSKDIVLVEQFASPGEKRAVISSDLLALFKKETAEKGSFSALPSVEADGTVTDESGVVHRTDENSKMSSVSGTPVIDVLASGDGLYIEGIRSFDLNFTDGKSLVGERRYKINATPDASGGWIITSLKEEFVSMEIVDTAELAQRKAIAQALNDAPEKGK